MFNFAMKVKVEVDPNVFVSLRVKVAAEHFQIRRL